MPQKINVNGQTFYQPGVYATVNATALAGVALDINRVAIVGDFPFLKQATPTEVSDATSLAGLDPQDDDLKMIAKLLYAPSNDVKVPGGPSAVILTSANPSTQALSTGAQIGLNSGQEQIVFKSAVYGPAGNRTSVTIGADPSDPAAPVVTITRDGITEAYSDLKNLDLFTVAYSGSEAETMTLESGPTRGIVINQTFKIPKPASNTTSTLTPTTGLLFDGTLSFAMKHNDTDAATAPTPKIDIVITGTTVDGTAGATETVTITGPANTGTSAKHWVSIDSIVAGATLFGDNAYLEVSNKAMDLTPAEYPKVWQAFNAINGTSTTSKLVATSNNPKYLSTLTSTLDLNSTPEDIKGSSAGIDATLNNIISTISSKSALVECTRFTANEGTGAGCFAPDITSTVTKNLIGGGKTSPLNAAHWGTAIDSLRTENVQIVMPLTKDSYLGDDTKDAIANLAIAHCKFMASGGQNERNAWYGRTQSTLTNAKVFAKSFNSRHLAVCGQEIQLADAFGQLKTLGAEWLALMCAGVQAGTGIAVPMTRKRMNVIDVTSSWDANANAGSLIQNGLVVLTKDRLGFRIERSVTSYLTDDNPVFSEVSANESLNTCIRDLRNFVENRLGDPNTVGIAALVRQIALTRLNSQVQAGIIKAFSETNLAVVDLGDRLRIDVQVAVVEPINFIEINAEIRRDLT